jgi:2-polyprenyl-3-methyl-5-hydroxy-6-metoxy-1,4-benzoquinol methylase
MKKLDRFLQRARIKQAEPYIKENSRVLDIGCSDGVLFQILYDRIEYGLGIDPDIFESQNFSKYELRKGHFPKDIIETDGLFDAITILAVVEHIPTSDIPVFVDACIHLLKPGGYIVITVPSKIVDEILVVMKFIGLIDGMALEQHHHYEPAQIPRYFLQNPIVFHLHKRFQLGLNNLFVFYKV